MINLMQHSVSNHPTMFTFDGLMIATNSATQPQIPSIHFDMIPCDFSFQHLCRIQFHASRTGLYGNLPILYPFAYEPHSSRSFLSLTGLHVPWNETLLPQTRYLKPRTTAGSVSPLSPPLRNQTLHFLIYHNPPELSIRIQGSQSDLRPATSSGRITYLWFLMSFFSFLASPYRHCTRNYSYGF